MRHPKIFLPTLLLLLLSVSGAAAQVVPGMRGADMQQELQAFTHRSMQEVQQELRNWSAAWRSRDAGRLASHYSADALLMVGQAGLARGRHEVQAMLGRVVGTSGEINMATDDFSVSGDIAYTFGRFWFDGDRAAAAATPQSGNFMMVLRRRGRGWEIRSQVMTPGASPTRGTSVGGAAGSTNTLN